MCATKEQCRLQMDSGAERIYVDTLSETKISPAFRQWGESWTADLEAESLCGHSVCSCDNITIGWDFKRLKKSRFQLWFTSVSEQQKKPFFCFAFRKSFARKFGVAWCSVPGSILSCRWLTLTFHDGCEGVVADNTPDDLFVHASLNGAVLLLFLRGGRERGSVPCVPCRILRKQMGKMTTAQLHCCLLQWLHGLEVRFFCCIFDQYGSQLH